MKSIITTLFLSVSIIIVYGIVDYYNRKELKKCKIIYMPRPE